MVDNAIRKEIPKNELETIIDNIGLPYSQINLSYSNSGQLGSADGDIMVSLSEKHRPTADYVRALRAKLPREFPGVTFYFLPADIVTQILNFGLPAPIDLQIIGQRCTGQPSVCKPSFAATAEDSGSGRSSYSSGFRWAEIALAG